MPRPKLKTEDRQAALVEAALDLAAQRSPAEVTTGDLAQAIGITQGAVFKHFDSKEAIWLAALDWAHQALIAKLAKVAQRNRTNPLQALRAVFMAHIAFVQAYPGVPRLIFQELQHARPTPLKSKVQALMADYRALVSGLLKDANDQGQTRHGVDTNSAAILFMGAVQGLVMQTLITGSLSGMTKAAKAVFNIVEAGLVAESTTPGKQPS